MKRSIALITFAVLSTPWGLTAQEHGQHAANASSSVSTIGKQVTCPVMGGEIDKDVFTEYEGQKVYFCCPPCAKKFKDSPGTYLPALYEQLYPQRVQVKCPVMGGVVNPDVFAEHKGQRVNFCCKGCDAKFKAEPDKYIAKLPEVSTTQVHCPITGKPINPQHGVEFGGKTIYFADKDSASQFQANPKKYADALLPEASLLAHGASAKDDLLLCPVCLPKDAVHKRSEVEMITYNGFRYALCAKSCVEKFKAEPGKYTDLLQKELVTRAGGEDKAYTCPMHAQVIRKQAGKCPICAMNLVPAAKSKKKM